MNQSHESLVLFSLGSRLSSPDEPDVKPLTTREWSELERKLELNSIDASKLPGLTSAQIESDLQIDPGEADRIARLLARSHMLQQELERLEALGIWLLTRFDEGYPPKLIARLGRAAPLMLYGAGDAQLLNQRGLAVIGSRNGLRDGDYYGTAVNRAARVMAAAHGGQIVVSLATEELVRDALPDDVTLVDLGEHRLRDLSPPERVFQLVHADLLRDFPPLQSLDAFPAICPASQLVCWA